MITTDANALQVYLSSVKFHLLSQFGSHSICTTMEL